MENTNNKNRKLGLWELLSTVREHFKTQTFGIIWKYISENLNRKAKTPEEHAIILFQSFKNYSEIFLLSFALFFGFIIELKRTVIT